MREMTGGHHNRRIAVTMVLGLASPAAAGPLFEMPASACRADIQRLCSDVSAGRGRIVVCLSDKRERLSSPCLAFLLRAEQSLRR